MFAWIEAGRSNTFQGIGAKDVIFRTASTSNNIVLGNACNSDGAACAYIHENRLGLQRLPMQGANLDVNGNAAISKGLSVYDISFHQSNFNLRAPSCTHVTHSNIGIVSSDQGLTDGPIFYADATGYARTHTMVASTRKTVVAAVSNLTIQSIDVESEEDLMNVTIADDFRGPAFDYLRKGASIVFGNTQYRVTDVGTSANAHTLFLESDTPSQLRRDDILGVGSNVVAEIVSDIHNQLIDTGVWPRVVISACSYESRSQDRVMRVYCQDESATHAFQDVRTLIGEFVTLCTAANADSGRSIAVRIIATQTDFQQGFYFDVCAPDMSAFADAASQYIQWTNGDTLLVRPLSSSGQVKEKSIQSVAISRTSTSHLAVTIANEQVDDIDWLQQHVRPSTVIEGANSVVRIAIATPTGSLRVNVVQSSFDVVSRTLTVEIEEPSLMLELFAVQGTTTNDCSILLRVVGNMVRVINHQAIDDTRTDLVFDTQDAGFMSELAQMAGSFDGFAFVSGMSTCALLHRVLSFGEMTGSVMLRPWSYQNAITTLPTDYYTTFVVFKPALRSSLADPSAPPISLATGVCIGDVVAPYAALNVAGSARVESKLSLVDAASSTMSAEVTFTSNVISIGHVPAAIPHERAPKATQPAGISITASNIHMRYPLLVDGQVTAKTVRTTSDARLKKNVVDTNGHDDLKCLLSIDVKRFHFMDEDDDAKKHVGVIAQSIAPIVPSAVGRAVGVVPLTVPITCTLMNGNAAAVVMPEHHVYNLDMLHADVTVKWRCHHPIANGTAIIASRSQDMLYFYTPVSDSSTLPSCGGSVIDVIAIIDDIHVIDTTELLCMTMSAVKNLHREVVALREESSRRL